MSHRIGIIGGDGIGPEVVAEALKVVARRRRRARHRSTTTSAAAATCATARCCPTPTSTSSRGLDAILLGAVGTPDVPPGVHRAGPAAAAALRARPLRQPAAVRAPSRNDGVDFVVVRENTEGTYAGEGGFLRKGTPHEVATQGSVNTRMGVERCVRYAFDLARVPATASTSRWCTRPTC